MTQIENRLPLIILSSLLIVVVIALGWVTYINRWAVTHSEQVNLSRQDYEAYAHQWKPQGSIQALKADATENK